MGFFKLTRSRGCDRTDPAEEPNRTDGGLYTTAGVYGLRTLAESRKDIIDIVFVHGLTGNLESTWTWKEAGETVFWPQDLLPGDIQNVRIMTFGYDADIVGVVKTAGSNTLRDHGKSLADDLAMRRKRTKTTKRPLIFVAHSLGGLVAEEAILISRGSSEPHVKALVEGVSAFVFMGTPHLGSRHADWVSFMTHMSRLLHKADEEIVDVLRPGSEVLAAVQQEFHTLLEDRRRNEHKFWNIFCFYEELVTPGLDKKIVSDQSAILTDYPNKSIHATHSGMTKFRGRNDPEYEKVRDRLAFWCENIQEEMEAAAEEGTAREETPPPRLLLPSSSSVHSGGGPLFMADVSAGRDFNVLSS